MTTERLTAETQSLSGALPLEVRVARTCAREPAPATPKELLASLQAQVPELELTYATARAGWYRLGGVVDADYRLVAPDIEEWAEQVAGGDLNRLLDRCAALHGFATRLDGRTHYLTAGTGEGAADFIRFFADWDRSSARESAIFCERWILSIREYQDANGDGRLSAKPMKAAVVGEDFHTLCGPAGKARRAGPLTDPLPVPSRPTTRRASRIRQASRLRGTAPVQKPRLVMFHKQSTSARTRFLMLDYGGVCAFGGLPDLSQLVEAGEEPRETLAHHPASVIGRAERELGLAPGSLEGEGGFRAKVDAPEGLIEVFLARFTSIDPPFDWAEQHGARFIDLTQARSLPDVELQILRRAYEQILG